MNIYEEYNVKGKKNITTSKNDFIEAIGEDGIKTIIKGVFLGGNVRDVTEFITQCRLIISHASIIDLFSNNLLLNEESIENYSSKVIEGLLTSNGSEKLIYLWLLGLTKKGLDNIVRTAENIKDYKDKFDISLNESVEELEEIFGPISGEISLGNNNIKINWKILSLIFLTIGAQTLTIRGSAKSMNGKLFEKLVLGSILTILGFTYCKTPPQVLDNSKKIFWLSNMDENERETDATIVYNGKAISIDIGFIGRGNPEISLDKVTRFQSYKEIGNIKHVMSTIIIVDTVGENSDLINKAERINGKIIQMKKKDWIYHLSENISEKLEVENILTDINISELDNFLEEKLNDMNIYEFI